MTDSVRAFNILVAALGGEGGGVLADWLTAAAILEGYPVQSTSIPGVAQRTGATTYYLEIFPERLVQNRAAQPILALTPTPADIDVVVASELVECGRALQNGFVTPERTTLITSTSRVYAIGEKSAMTDGQFDHTRLLEAAQALARRAILFDMSAAARETGSQINAVMFGALIGSGALPIGRGTAENAIRRAGKSVELNLRGFAAGFDRATRAPAEGASASTTPEASAPSSRPTSSDCYRLDATIRAGFPPEVQDVVMLGARRLIDYQDKSYAELYLARLAPILRLNRAAGAGNYELTRETARVLALWMSYEDVIRVADLKTRADRFTEVRGDEHARPTDIVRVTEFLKPGLDELCSVLPPRLAKALLAYARRRGIEDKLNVGLHIRSTDVSGFLLLRLLNGLRWWRPRSWRYVEEQALIVRWLAAIERAAACDTGLALEVAACGQLVKGYGDTHRRARRSFDLIAANYFDADLERSDVRAVAQAVRTAREAAFADPEGTALQLAIDKSRASIACAASSTNLSRRVGPLI
jgi:indolepyruvate ferredoxin oxidoreductase beta subunit